MTITREQVADLQPGDVVEYSGHPELKGAKIVGPLHVGDTGSLCVADYVVRGTDGEPSSYRRPHLTLTVVSRPLYVNHPRTEPVPGDVVTYPDGHIEGIGPWFAHRSRQGGDLFWMSPSGPVAGEMPFPMRLLVDGETGQVVP